ncbi:methyltransferase domain-containing protein [Candidatus Kuenenia sp.]|uniref:class I SAM-dependent methyltransferase n=1 Tax=Candidatus Kuenenia sp. TaxID=2499824 RepID=UPI0032201703
MIDLEQQVKRANKDFYDIIGHSYEAIDGRRSERLIRYVEIQFEKILNNTNANSILDLGCGGGFISRIAKDYFKHRYAVDISHKIIKSIEDKTLYSVTADTDMIPIKDAKLNCVVTFAVLHHCYSYEKILSEIYRVLTKGGIYYSDHDMDSFFFRRFKPLLNIYRKINDASRDYMAKFNQLSEDMYNYSEFHQNGIPSPVIETTLKRIGFKDVRYEYHWYGLSLLTDKMFGKRSYKRGYAPLVRIFAVK